MSKWSVIGSSWNTESEQMVQYIEEKTGCQPKFFALYSTMMAFIRHAGIDENHPVAYRNGHLVGNMKKLQKVIG